MGGEFKSFIIIWISAILSLCYSFYTSKKIPRGFPRFLSLLPIVVLFLLIPLHLSTIHLCGITAFFLSWLANFKLLLLAFGTGPLSHSSLDLPRFIFVACLPIQIRNDPPPKSDPSLQTREKVPGFVSLPLKIAALAIFLKTYEHREGLNRLVVLALYCLHLYIELDMVLLLSATAVRGVIGFEIEPQFHAPYLATSLQDFWGRRWNLMVPSILRPIVYQPTRGASERFIGTQCARLVALLSSFVVSGIMHELIFYYFSRAAPTWEVTWFFVLQGVCTAVEVAAKKTKAVSSGRLRLHRAVSGPLTVAFVAVTGAWLFFPQLKRDGVVDRVIGECLLVANYIKGLC